MATDGLEFKTYTFQSGAVYEGTFKGTKRHGKGHWRHPEGEVYEGQYVENKQHGKGIYIFGNTGKRYLGDWVQGEMSGEGIYYFSGKNTTYYVGGYDRDKKHGRGFYRYENGVVTAQTWNNGELSLEVDATPADRIHCANKILAVNAPVKAVAPKELGPTPQVQAPKTFQFPSGATYTGEYDGKRKHGVGQWEHPDGDSYSGQFEDNKHSGWGVYVNGRSGKKYVGQWEDGKMHGWGVYFFNPSETEYFVGQYLQDRKDGNGLYHFAESGHNKYQVWEQGQLKKESDADEATTNSHGAAIKALIAIVSQFATNYHPSSSH